MLSDGVLNSSKELYGRAITIEPEISVEDCDHIEIGNMELIFIEINVMPEIKSINSPSMTLLSTEGLDELDDARGGGQDEMLSNF